MIAPVAFAYNPETATSNVFQKSPYKGESDSQEMARTEFLMLADGLRNHGVQVISISDTEEPHTPDSIFPNNWFSTHSDGTIVLYPMLAKNRRLERRGDILTRLSRTHKIQKIHDYSGWELDNEIVEGTGSLIFDRTHKVVYACLSSRTTMNLLQKISRDLGYELVAFQAKNRDGSEIYHTNVLMALGHSFAVICLDAISDLRERQTVLTALKNSGREVMRIDFSQMHQFAGNILQLSTAGDGLVTAMSKTAHDCLNLDQLALIAQDGPILAAEIPTIERLGGGSVRCMLAEIYLSQFTNPSQDSEES